MAFTNLPSDNEYNLGDVVVVSVTFSGAVQVSERTSGRLPRVRLSLNSSLAASYADYDADASSDTVLVFRKTVNSVDDDTIRVGIAQNGLELNGAIIRTIGSVAEADVSHGAVTGANIRTRSTETIEITSEPDVSPTYGEDDVYGPGEEMEFTVTFDEAVTVNATNGTPELRVNVGAADVHGATYRSGSGTAGLVFAWTVPAALQNDGDVSVPSNLSGTTLVTVRGLVANGGAITNDSDVPVNIRHLGFSTGAAVDTTPPVLMGGGGLGGNSALTRSAGVEHGTDGATVDGTELVLMYEEPGGGNPDRLDETSVPAPGNFEVTVEGTTRAVSSVTVSDATVILNLASPVSHGQTVQVDYTPGANPIRDLWANAAAAVEDRPVRNDSAEPTLSIEDVTVNEGDGTADFTVALDASSGETVTVEYTTTDGTATAGADYTAVSSEIFTFTAGETTVTLQVAIADDSDDEPDETFTITLGNASHATIATATATATGTIEDNDEAGLTARFENVPTSHDGSTTFTVELRFSEEIQISYRTLRDTSLEVSSGTVTRARRETRGSNIGWTITIEPDTDGDITIAVPAGRACNAAGAVCTADGTQLSSRVDATVPGPASEVSEVSIAAGTNPGLQRSQASNPVTEGAPAVFTLTRTGDTATALTVNVTVSESGAMLSGTPPATATFEIGSATATLTVATDDDEVAEVASEITAALATGNGYSLESGAASAAVTVQDDDAAPIVTTALPVLASENGVAVVALTATDDDTPVANLAWSIATGADAALFALSADGVLAFAAAKDFEAPDDANQDGDYEVTLRVTDGANPVDATLTVRLTDVDEVAPVLSSASVDGDALTLTFSEVLDGSASPASSAFSVTVGGTARGVSNVSMSASTVTLTLASVVVAGETVTVGYTVPTGANANPLQDAADNAVAAFSGQAVTNETPVHVNTPATGKPAISGTARVGKTLTASASGIADTDGLTNATFAWQWIANDGTADTDIAGATGSTYALTAAEEGKTVKVRVTLTDDAGTEETLVSDATAEVAAGLTATFQNIPERHDGSTAFVLRVAFSEAVSTGYAAMRDHAFEVAGGTVTRARRIDWRSDLWELTIEPSSDAAVTLALPADRACNVAGAICTRRGQGRMRLSNRPEATVHGPLPTVSIAAAASPVTEGTAASFTLERPGDTASELTVTLSVSEDGAVLGASPPTEAVFAANASTATLAIATEDDEVAEAASIVTVALATGTGYAVAANASQATVTVEDDDVAPVIADTGPFTVDENGTAVVTLTATDTDTTAADLAWSIAGGADEAAFTLSADGVLAFAAVKDFEAPDDADRDGGYQVTVRVTDGANPVDATLTIRLTDVDEIAPVLSGASVDGASLTLTFDEGLGGNSSPAASAFSVAVGGTARGVSDVSIGGSTVTLTLASAVVAGETATVSYTVPVGANANPLRDAAAGFSDRAVTNATPENNTAPTGLPTIAGTARVGETLTASAAGIADDDELTNAVFAWQWIVYDGTADAEIAGATEATYTLTAAEAGKTVKVRASFTDDGGTAETLVSEATAAVAAALPVISVEAASSTTTEGRAAKFTLKRTGAVASALEVSVSVTQAGAVLSGTPASTVTFAAGNAEARLRLATDDDDVAEADGRVTVSVVSGSGYGVDANASAATVDVYDNDEATTTTETLWTSTLTVESIGGALLGTVGGGNALSPDGWSEDGEAFEVEQLYYFPEYSELAFTLSVAPSETGQLTLHLDDLQVQLRGSPGVRYFYWVVGHPGWQAGQTVAVKLTRTDPDAVVAAGPGVSVADAQVQEAEGAALAFRVTLDTAQSSAVSVRYATSDGTATAGADYVATSGALRFEAGETAKTVSVPVLNDAHDEGSETLTLTLSHPFGAELADGTATGTINNTGPIPQAWIARFGRTVAEQVVEAVEARMRAPRVPGVEISLAGQRIGGPAGKAGPEDGAAQAAAERNLADWLRNGTDPEGQGSFGSRTLTQHDLLTGSSFAMTGGTQESGFYALWARGAVTRFDGRDGGLSLDGEVASSMLGADWTRGALMAGLVVSHSLGEGSYRGEDGNGGVTSSLTGLYPWGRYSVSERLSLWGIAGYGEGTLTLTPEGQAPTPTDLDLMMAAAGLRGVLVQAPEAGGFELAVKSDALGVHTSTAKARDSDGGNLEAAEAEVTRLRLGIEGSRPFRFASGATLTPSAEIGVRLDGGDAETGFGVDIGGGLAWSDPQRGLSAELRGRGLLSHEAKGFGERGFSGSLGFDPTPDTERGLKLTLSQTVGAQAAGGMDALLSRGTVAGLAANDNPGAGASGDELAQRRFEMRLGYGLAAFGDRFTGTPEIGFGFSGEQRDYSLGWRLTRAARHRGSFELSLEARRREIANDEVAPEHAIGFKLTVRY